MEAMKREVERYGNSRNVFFTLLPDKYKNELCGRPSLSYTVNRQRSRTAGRSIKEFTKGSIREFDLMDKCWSNVVF